MSSVVDLGDIVPLGIQIYDSAGALANATAVVVTVYKPDGTSSQGTVTNPTTGYYNCDYTPALVGRYVVKWSATGTNASSYVDEFTVRDIAYTGILSLSEAKAHLNIPDTSTSLDEELRRFIDSATDLAENYTGLVLGRQTFTDTFNGGVDQIKIRNPKIISVTSIVENGNTLVEGTDFYTDYTGQRIHRIGTSSLYYTNAHGLFAPGVQNVVITYVAGFTNPPAGVRQGVLEILRHTWQTQRGSMNVLNKNADDGYNPGSTYSIPRRASEYLDQASLPGIA